ncbi:MAG: hypothetical protein ACWGN2_03125 [Anaerolineales bacterium]
MELILLIAAAGLIGYFFARSRYSKHVDNAADSVSAASREYAGKTTSWWRRIFGGSRQAESFESWVAGPESSQLPDEFKSWFASLSENEQKDFTHALDGYLKGLGYDLDQLLDDSLANKPALLQSYVEAVVVYSDAFRKAQEASQEAKTSPEEAEENSPPTDGKKPAEKSTSRRRGGSSESPSAA